MKPAKKTESRRRPLYEELATENTRLRLLVGHLRKKLEKLNDNSR